MRTKLSWPKRTLRLASIVGIPEPNRLIRARRGELPAVWSECYFINITRMAARTRASDASDDQPAGPTVQRRTRPGLAAAIRRPSGLKATAATGPGTSGNRATRVRSLPDSSQTSIWPVPSVSSLDLP